MRVNEHTALLSQKVLLVPYCQHHVPTYHEWMQDPALQEATASEPLTLEQEFAMQQSWRVDADKLTFIACLPPDEPMPAKIAGGIDDVPERMIGDVNLFLSTDEEQADVEADCSVALVGELELMVARKEKHGQGFGRAIALAMLQYIVRFEQSICLAFAEQTTGRNSPNCQLAALRVRIGEKNERSIRLFEGLGFRKSSEKPSYFGEWEMRLKWEGDMSKGIQELLSGTTRLVGEDGTIEYEMAERPESNGITA